MTNEKIETRSCRPPIPFEDHHEFIREQARLELNFLWRWLESHPGEDFKDALRGRVDLTRKTDPRICYLDKVPVNYSHAGWPRIEAGLSGIFTKLKACGGTAEDFEDAAYKLCSDDLLACAEFSYHHGDYWAAFDTYQCGSLKFDPPAKDTPKTVSFHIKNALAPKSIFDDPGYIPGCLLDLMEKAEKQYGADTIQTDTWLNSLPKWTAIFPEEWQHNMGPENKDVGWGYGHWGQFISASGKFNRKYGDILRSTGEFPFWPRKSHCSINSLKRHLQA